MSGHQTVEENPGWRPWHDNADAWEALWQHMQAEKAAMQARIEDLEKKLADLSTPAAPPRPFQGTETPMAALTTPRAPDPDAAAHEASPASGDQQSGGTDEGQQG